jgi:ABC-type transport system involved in multi-copper enzyme maturation permease subunit
MNRALTRRLLQRLWPLLALSCVAVFFIAHLFVVLIEPLGGIAIFQYVLRNAVIAQIVGAAEIDMTTLAGVASIAYIHFLVLLILAVWPISIAATALAGDIELGEADLILSRAVPRRAPLIAAWVTLLIGAAALGASLWLGTALGDLLLSDENLPLRRFALAALDSVLLTLAMGAVAILLSTLSSERGRVIALAAALWILNYFNAQVAPIFQSLRWLEPWSLQGHSNPQSIVAAGHLRTGDFAIIAAIIAACLILSAVVWHRRDIRV